MKKHDQKQESPAEQQRKKETKRETRAQTMLALRGVLAAYLVYLGYDLIRNTVTSEDDMGNYFYLYILVGVVFAVVGVYVLISTWKMKKKRDAEERAVKRAELEKKGLLNFDEDTKVIEPETDDAWGYRPEETSETAYTYKPEESETADTNNE